MADELFEQHREAFAKRGFELGERLGSGASGAVYKALQSSVGRAVAIKIFLGLQTAQPAVSKRFRRESIILGRLDHPSIPFVLTAGQLHDRANTPYHVMQFVDRERLSTLLERSRRLPCRTALLMTRQVLGALAHAAEADIVHRDVAPDNILTSRSGRVFLIDFSLGMSISTTPGLTRVTESGSQLGRAVYASPEQRRGASEVDARTDVYSMGVVLFEMLTGTPELGLGQIDRLLPEAPKSVRLAVRAACERDPRCRPSAAEFLRAIEEAFEVGVGSDPPLPGIAMCPNPHCRGATWSQRGYLRAPNIQDHPAGTHCADCGARLLRLCASCHTLLPTDLRERYSTRKGDRAARVHCAHCGTLFFEVPSCRRCTSLLLEKELEADTSSLGCSKCPKPTDSSDAPL